MIYLLKTETQCNNNCAYCANIERKAASKKSLKVIENELEGAVLSGYKKVRLSCNTDNRSDFLKILDLAKKLGLQIILETNGRVFSHEKNILRIDNYIDKYEFYFSFTDADLAFKINQVDGGYYEQTALGLKNMVKAIKSSDKLLVKVVLLNANLFGLPQIVDTLILLGVRNVKFVYFFKNSVDDLTPSMSWVSQVVDRAKKQARQNGIKIVLGDDFEHNPYSEEIKDYLDTSTAELRIEKKIHESKPHFSVIIPTYNKVDTLPYVIKSFLNQNYGVEDYEIIIVDDGSTDKTEQMIKKIKSTCNLKYIYWPRIRGKKNANYRKFAKFYNRAGTTRNIGLEHAEGNIVLFSDADIIVDTYCLKKHNEYHKESEDMVVRGFRMFLPDDFVMNKSKEIDFDNLRKDSVGELIIRKRAEDCRYYSLLEEGWEKVISANLSIRKKNIDLVGAFSNDSPFWGYEDVEFGYKLKLANLKLVWSDRIKVFHLPHEKQTGDVYQTMATFWINTNIFYRKYLDKKIYELYKQVIINRLDQNTFFNNK